MRAQRSPLERAPTGADEIAPEADLSQMMLRRRKSGVAADRMAALEVVHNVSGPAEAASGDGLFFKKGFATAEGFRPSYWVYERRAEDEPPDPPAGRSAPPAEETLAPLASDAPAAVADEAHDRGIAALLEDPDADAPVHPLVGNVTDLEPEADLSKIIIRRVHFAPEVPDAAEPAAKAGLLELPADIGTSEALQPSHLLPEDETVEPIAAELPASIELIDDTAAIDPPRGEPLPIEAPEPPPTAIEAAAEPSPIEPPASVLLLDDTAVLEAPAFELPPIVVPDAAGAAAPEPIAVAAPNETAISPLLEEAAAPEPVALVAAPPSEAGISSLPVVEEAAPEPAAPVATPEPVALAASSSSELAVSPVPLEAAPPEQAMPAADLAAWSDATPGSAPAVEELPAADQPRAAFDDMPSTLPPIFAASARAKADPVAGLPLVAELTAVIASVLSSKTYPSQQQAGTAPEPQGRAVPTQPSRKPAPAAARLVPPVLVPGPLPARSVVRRVWGRAWPTLRVVALSIVVLVLWVRILTYWFPDGQPFARFNPFIAAPAPSAAPDANAVRAAPRPRAPQ